MSKSTQRQTCRREFLKHGSFAAAAVLLGLGRRAGAEAHRHAAAPDDPNTHNMLIVGREAVFLSHLPMFNDTNSVTPHRYQVILEAAFTKPGGDPQAVYADDRRRNPGVKIYTLNPEEFVLPRLRAAGGEAPLASFGAKIFRGHLERRGSRVIAEGVTVGVRNVVHFREFDPAAASPSKLEYILFGKGGELFLAHFIARPPDFDQVLSVSAPGRRFTDEELGRGLRVTFDRPNTIAQRLSTRQEAVGEVRDERGTVAPLKVRFKAGAEIYFEEGELRVPANFNPTAAEKRAGFN
jgi:hypothetical protein